MMFAASAERIGAARVAKVSARLAEAVAEGLTGDVRVEREGATIVLTGRRLRARSIDDPRLRAIGLLAKVGR